MIELRDIKGRTLYRSDTAKSFREALVEAVAQKVPLPMINLDGRDLAGLTLTEIHAPGASCRGTHLRQSHLQRAYMPDSDFSGSNLGAAEAPEANFSGSNFTAAQLVAINMPSANLDRIHGKGVQASNAILDYCTCREADLPAINLNEGSLLGTDWTDAKLLAGNFHDVKAMRSKLHNVAGARTKFNNADLRWSSLSGDFSFASFPGAVLHEVTVSGTLTLTGARFEGASGIGPDVRPEAVHLFLLERTGERLRQSQHSTPTAAPTQ